MPNPLRTLQDHGQSIWLDYIRRGLITSGELRRLIEVDGLTGVTSNPAISEKAIPGSTDYEGDLRALEGRTDLDAKAMYEVLAIRDVQESADVLGPVYAATDRRDGYVSLEVSPALAHDTPGTIEEARRLWAAVGRQTAMIKVPATPAGIPAIRDLIGEGINVNVTLLFGQETYERVAVAYIAGLERFAASGGDVWRVASVASFFVSRIDSLVDRLVADRLESAPSPAEQVRLQGLLGKVAIANARLAYQRYAEIYRQPRWVALAAQGGQTQRLLWASTGTKNPRYRDVVYVEELIGPETVNTLPPATLDAFRDHGRPRPSLDEGLAEATDTMAALETSGISMKHVTDQLLEEGVALFADAFAKLLDAVRQRCRARIEALGAWIEQLLAESTGKAGMGVIPVDREPLGSPRVYGTDRLFVYLRLGAAPDPLQDAAVAALEQAGQPVVRIALDDPYDLGVEFFRWEFATAVAGSIIGVNPFDQPDVEASKAATRRLMAEHATTGGRPAEAPILEAGPIALFADERNRAALAAAGARTLVDTLRAHLERIRPGNYLALLAYLETNDVNAAELQAMRTAVRDRYRIATCLGFGPRFLHSTGQAYKGGPNSGVFLQITCDDARDLPVPGQRYTFGAVKAAQARGDFQVLAERGRRALRVHLRTDVKAGLALLRETINGALA